MHRSREILAAAVDQIHADQSQQQRCIDSTAPAEVPVCAQRNDETMHAKQSTAGSSNRLLVPAVPTSAAVTSLLRITSATTHIVATLKTDTSAHTHVRLT
jgi:hypothetical protein